MNEIQRRQIWAMRSQGIGYGTVVQQMIEAQGFDYCLQCGMPLTHKPVGRPKKFCSTAPG